MHCDVLFTVALGGLLARRLIINLIKCLVLYFSENTGDRGTPSVEKTDKSRTWGITQDSRQLPFSKRQCHLKERKGRGTVFNSERLMKHSQMQCMNLDWFQKGIYTDVLVAVRGIWNGY